MFSFSSQPQTITEVFNDGWMIYKQTFKSVWWWVFVLMIITSLPLLSSTFIHREVTHGLSWEDAAYSLFNLVVSAYFVSVILHRIYAVVRKGDVNIGLSTQIAKQKYLTVLLALLIVSILLVLGLTAFLIPGIFIFVLFIFFMPAILFDDKSSIDAIKYSTSLVWGNWWFTFVVILIPVIVMTIIQLLLAILMGLENYMGMAIVKIVLGTLFVPYFNSLILVQYNNLKMREKKAHIK